MGKGGSGFHSSRAEFLAEDALNGDLRYSRNGGCFVTTKKAMAFVILAVVSLLLVILLMYYYGPNRKLEETQKESNDIEKLINETVNKKVSEENLRLPKTIYPLHYKLKIHPILDENSDDNFTFTGEVKIHVHAIKNTNKIVLNWDDINITESDINVSAIKIISLPSDSLKTDESSHTIKRNANETESTTITDQALETTTISETELINENQTLSKKHSSALTDAKMEGLDPNDVYVLFNGTESDNNTAIKDDEMVEIIPLDIDTIEKDEDNFKLIIVMKNNLEAGQNYTVDLKFSGEILNNLVGLYRTSYTDLSGATRWLATTHFQPVYARKVFPCFDEPAFKATFEISVARRTNMTVLSNMPLRDTEPMSNTTDGWVWDHFEKSLPMSTYVVAFTISDFESLRSNSTSAGPIFRVWAPKHNLQKAQYALDVAQEILPFLEDYFGIKYPLPKLDMLSIPNFAKIGMENWGLISFREASLLFDPATRTIKSKSYIFNVIAHELSHQWFGNLVTMKWWNDLWLNEGFGAFMAEIVQTHLRPQWQIYSSFRMGDRYEVLQLDSLKSAHSIQTDIKSTAQIDQFFDKIVYAKGCSILQMLNYTLTREVFQEGLHDYLKKFSYQATTQDDLWEVFTRFAQNQSILPENVTVKTLMNSWTTQSGHPLVTLNRDYASGMATVNQSKIIDGNITKDTLWYVPVSYVTSQSDQLRNVWLLNTRSTVVNLTENGNNSWILLNIDEKGFYRVNYDLHNWKLLQMQLRRDPSKIPPSNRAQLLDDAFQLAYNGLLNYTVPFELTKYLNAREVNFIPWYSALTNMDELRVVIRNYEYSGLYDNFMLKLIRPMFLYLNTKEKPYENRNNRLLRLHLVTYACKLRETSCIAWTRDRYKEWMNVSNPDDMNPIPVDYRYIVQCNAVKSGGLAEWDFLWNRTLSPTIEPADLETAYLSLGCTHDPWLINKYLELSLSGNITVENAPLVWKSINHPVGVRIGFQFLRLNWDRIYKTYEDIYIVFSTIFSDFLSQLTTEIDLEDLTTFYKLHQNDLKSVATILQGTVEQMKVQINWKKNHLDSIIAWLKQNRF